MLSCVLLCAGQSQRFGSPKALAEIGNGQTVLEYLLATILSTRIDEIVVVLGADADRIKPYLLEHKKLKVVYNKDYILGQTSSVQAGLQVLSADSQGFFLLPVDCPWVSGSSLERMIEVFLMRRPFILIPVYEGRRGHPPLISICLKQEICDLSPARGVSSVFASCPQHPLFLPVQDPGVVLTFNTFEEFRKIREQQDGT